MSCCTPRRRRRARPRLVALEDRTLLAAESGAFASFSGTFTGPYPRAAIPLTISRADFTLASGHVLLGLDMQTPDRLRIGPDGPGSVRTLASPDGSGYRVVELGAGTYTLDVSATGPAGQSYRIAVSLAGDPRGAFQVNSQDLATIRTLQGERKGHPGYLAAADVNHDGVINARDLRLARLNVGAATQVRPLAVTLGLGPSVATTAGGAVYQPTVNVHGQTTPGARVVLYGVAGNPAITTLSSDPSLVPAPSLTTTADAQGRYAFTISTAVGANALHVVATDGFGQQSSASLTITRIVDTTPPTIAIQSPAAGSTANHNITVSGRVTDDLTGVATLQEQVDSGPFQAVAVDAAGNFRFATPLALDGTADGPHTVVLRATDGAGNGAQASTTFTLATSGVNRAVTTDPGEQQMPSIVVDPLDANHLVLAYMDRSLVTTGYAGIGVAVSHDAGATWQYASVPLPAGFAQGAANPIAKFDGQGHVFVSFMAATFLGTQPPLTNPDVYNPVTNSSDRVDGFTSNNGIFVTRSDDGGLTWNQPVAVSSHTYLGQQVFFEINPDLAIDTFPQLPDGQPNPNDGNLYVVFSRVYPVGQFPGHPEIDGSIDIMIAASRDGGQSWQLKLQPQPGTGLPVTTIQDPENTSGLPGLSVVDQPHITIGPEGDLYVSNSGDGDFTIHHSTDGGASFVGPDRADDLGVAFGTGFKTFVNSTLPNNQFRTQEVRAVAADPTRPGTLFATEAVQILDPLGNQVDGGDIFFGRSSDHGRTWQTTFMVGPDVASVLNDDNNGQPATGSSDDVISGQVLPRLSVDAQGNIAVIWYDTRRDPASHLLDVFGTVSTDGGQTFSPNFRLTDQSFDANAGKFIDATGQTNYYLSDFLGLAIANHTAYAAWTDTRNGNSDIEFTHVPISPPPAPPNDRFEPNNTPQTATDLGTVVNVHLPKLAIPAGDEDWFQLKAAATGDLTVTATPSDSRLGLQVELWDSSGSTRLASGSAVLGQSGEQLVYAGQSGESYLVHVMPSAGLADQETPPISPQYNLDVQSLTADLGAVVHAVRAGSLDPDEQSLYLVTAAASGALDLTLTPGSSVTGSFNLQILDPVKRTVLATGSPMSGGTIATNLAVQQGQTVLIEVSAGAGTAGDFAIEITNLDQFSTPQIQSSFLSDGLGPSHVALGDLNGDGNPDLVVANTLSNTISVFLGNGDGTFQAPRQFAVGAFATPGTDISVKLPAFGRDVAIADLNHDGIPDVVVTNDASGDVSVLLGRGDGTFAPQERFDATTEPVSLAVGDLNGDGIPDLSVISTSLNGFFTVAILLGRGDGTFAPEQTLTVPTGTGVNIGSVQIADVNGDGKADLLVAGSSDSRLSVLLGNGDGTFTPGGTYNASRLGAGLAAGDLNGDGKLDIANTAFDQTNEVSVLLGNGDGTFQASQAFTAGQNPVAVGIVDFGSQITLPDGSTALGQPDGHPDLVVADSGVELGFQAVSGPEVVVLPALFDSQGVFQGFGSPEPIAAAVAPIDLKVGDVNRDGAPDVMVVDRDGIRIIYSKPPLIPPNNTLQTARNLGTVVHDVEPTETIVPGHEDAYYSLTVPTETAHGAGNEVIDFSGGFRATAGAGLAMEVLDASGHVLGSGQRFQITAAQGAVLTLHVFGATASDGIRGAGAYTLDIDVLPQVVSVETQTLLPGQGGLPGGATASLVVTLQGDRLDPATAENPANYTVTWLGPDGKAGTADDQVIPLATSFQSVVYDPSANVDVTSGKVQPTAVRQTVTLLFANSLPAGSYQVTLSSAIQAAPFTASETSLLSGSTALAGHPVMSVTNGQITSGSLVTATDLVLQSGALGNLNTLKAGNAFLTQLHDDLSALLDAQKTAQGGQAQITPALIDQVLNRLEAGLGAPGHRTTTAVALLFDPVSIGVDDPAGDMIDYDLGSDDLTDDTMDSYVNVDNNIEIVIIFDPLMDVTDPANMDVTVDVSDVPPDASGAAVVLGDDGDDTMDLTDDLDNGVTGFDIPADPTDDMGP
jgi:hypothetical protein